MFVPLLFSTRQCILTMRLNTLTVPMRIPRIPPTVNRSLELITACRTGCPSRRRQIDGFPLFVFQDPPGAVRESFDKPGVAPAPTPFGRFERRPAPNDSGRRQDRGQLERPHIFRNGPRDTYQETFSRARGDISSRRWSSVRTIRKPGITSEWSPGRKARWTKPSTTFNRPCPRSPTMSLRC